MERGHDDSREPNAGAGLTAMGQFATAACFRAEARRRLPHFLFEYYDGAAFGGMTAAANEAELAATELRQRVLRDVSGLSTQASLFGEALRLPLALSPVGLAGMAWPRGEVHAARAAHSRGIPFALSTTSVCRFDEVTAAAGAPWLQLYMVRDRGFVEDLIAQAIAAGTRTLLLTVDVAVLGTRWRDTWSGLNDRTWRGSLRRGLQMAARPGWLGSVGLRGAPHNLGTIARYTGNDRRDLTACMAFSSPRPDDVLDWKAVEWVRARWPDILLVKGVLEPEDAREALRAGADGLVVSNHGGRQLDGVAPTARALPRMAQALGGDVPLLVDGGVRTGLDLLRMLALGASGVMLGRPWVFALACAGQRGVERLIDLLENELRVAMALTGCRDIAAIDASALRLAEGIGG